MLDKNRVKAFWDNRARTYQNVAFESIANLEQDPENLKLKIQLETEKVGLYLGPINDKKILDLGAGVGQWSFRFIEGGAKSVTAVEYSEPLANIGNAEAVKRGVNNLKFVVSEAEKFRSKEIYDVIFISGLFVYMSDVQAKQLVAHLPSFCHPDTVVLLRDGTGVPMRYEINNRMSNHLKTFYSAIYRTREEYIQLFSEFGFSVDGDENVFEEGCPLNKYEETRLRIYRLKHNF